MGFFDALFTPDINKGLAMWRGMSEGVLIDVRDQAEYEAGHIPGSVNVPMDSLSRITTDWPDRNTPLFLYCAIGRRSKQVASRLQALGYANVTSIGGIKGYKGELEKK